MFGPEFQKEGISEVLDQLKEEANWIDPDVDQGFDIQKSSNCSHLNTNRESKSRYIPEVEFNGKSIRVYCKKIEAKEIQHSYNQFSTIYSTVMTDIAAKFINMKQIIMAMFQSLDEYDKESITCGLLIMFPDDELQEKYEKSCDLLKQEVVRVIEVVDNDIKLCNNIQSEMFTSIDGKKVKAAQIGCLPIQTLRKRILHELDYILQRYQEHIVKVLGIAHKEGQHSESKSLWSYIRTTGAQAIEVVKRGLHKLLTFLLKNWDYIMGTMLLTLGPLIFFGIPTIAGSIAAYFSSLTAAGVFSGSAFSIICNFLTKIPILGYSLYKIIGAALISFFNMSAEEKVQKLGKTAQSWTKELAKHQKIIFENLGLNVTAAAQSVSGFIASPAFGAVMIGTQVVGQTIGKQIEFTKAALKKEKAWGMEALEFTATILKSGAKYWMIYTLQRVCTTGITLFCAGGSVLSGIIEVIKDSLNLSILFRGKSFMEKITEIIGNTKKQLGLESLYAETGPIRWLLEAVVLLAEFYQSEGIEGVINRILANERMVSGILQLVLWVVTIYLALKKLLHWGNVPPLTKNIAKMKPLLRSKVIDEALQTLRLPVQYYVPIEILESNTPSFKSQSRKSIKNIKSKQKSRRESKINTKKQQKK